MKQFFGTYLHDDRYSKTKETNYLYVHVNCQLVINHRYAGIPKKMQLPVTSTYN